MLQLNVCMKVDKDSVKPPPAVEETYRGVAAPSRPKVGNTAPIEEMPKVCQPADPSISPCCQLLHCWLLLLLLRLQYMSWQSAEWQR